MGKMEEGEIQEVVEISERKKENENDVVGKEENKEEMEVVKVLEVGKEL